MRIELTEEDIKMIKKEFSYVRCLYWDNKLFHDYPNNYCDGDCHHCKNPLKIEKWLKERMIDC